MNILYNDKNIFKGDGKMSEIRQKLLKEIGINKVSSNLTVNDWTIISHHHKLSEEFIREFQNKVEWHYISRFQPISENFISEFKHFVDWYIISENNSLSVEFIRKHQNELRWYVLTRYRKLSDDFLLEFQPKIDWEWYLKFNQASFLVMKNVILKASFKDIKEHKKWKTSHLNSVQLKEINNLLSLKHIFLK